VIIEGRKTNFALLSSLVIRPWSFVGLREEASMTTIPQGQVVRAHVFVSGHVQGVNFRWYTQRKAQELGVTGWVRNLWDGRVEAVFEGEEPAVRRAVDWCHVGPPSAWVDNVQVSYEQPTGESNRFRVTY
jgi:acylphosphatase